MYYLAGAKAFVCEIREIIGLSQSTISSHLKVLENSGLIDHEKDGLWVNYRISQSIDDNIRVILHEAISGLSKSKLVIDDLKRLTKINREDICSGRKTI